MIKTKSIIEIDKSTVNFVIAMDFSLLINLESRIRIKLGIVQWLGIMTSLCDYGRVIKTDSAKIALSKRHNRTKIWQVVMKRGLEFLL